MTTKIQAIPTNLITGFLGSGKTTAILNLLASRPRGSRWAVLVNEFGDVGIDGTLLEKENLSEGVFIKEVPGGCLCCAAGLPLQIALNLLIKKANPDRIIIEPTGVGHPKKVIEVLTGEFYKEVLDLKATICLVEAYKLTDKTYLNNESFIDQLNIADIVLASKSDQMSKEHLRQFYDYCKSFDIPKDHIGSIEFGQFATDLLDVERNNKRSVNFPDAHKVANKRSHDVHHETVCNATEDTEAELTTENGNWQKFENNGQGYYGCGWIFNHAIVFDEVKLEQFVKNDAFTRVKGIFHTNNDWLLFNRSEQHFDKQPFEQHSDSRIEIIEADFHDWNQVEQQLLACIYTD